MARSNNTIAFTGGGTAGHVFPAFPIIDRVKRAGYEVLWIGSERGMERNLVEAAGIRYAGIPSGKLRRHWSFRNFTDLFRIVAGFWRSFRLLRRERPVLLFSKGGFVTVPPVAAARLLGIPSFTHESDVDPALSTRLNLRFGARVLVAYDETLDYLPEAFRSRAVVVGNPVRDMMFQGDAVRGRRFAGLSSRDQRPLVLVLGGSQGAREVNELILRLFGEPVELCRGGASNRFGKRFGGRSTGVYQPSVLPGGTLPPHGGRRTGGYPLWGRLDLGIGGHGHAWHPRSPEEGGPEATRFAMPRWRRNEAWLSPWSRTPTPTNLAV